MTMTASLATVSRRNHQTTKDRCRIFHIGLDARETLVIESLFRANPELSERYVFGAPPPDEAVDLVFVNGDDEAALREWQQVQAVRPEAVALMVTGTPERHPGVRTLARPLNFRNFVTILDAITSTETPYFRNPANSVENEIRVLVVDDSFPARQFMKFKLEELATASALRVLVDVADSGEKALESARDNRYDLVFLDVVMPGIDGYETCRRLKQVGPMRVAMLTGRATPVDFTQGRNAGCDNYLPKPPNDVDLRTVLRLTNLKKMTALK